MAKKYRQNAGISIENETRKRSAIAIPLDESSVEKVLEISVFREFFDCANSATTD